MHHTCALGLPLPNAPRSQKTLQQSRLVGQHSGDESLLGAPSNQLASNWWFGLVVCRKGWFPICLQKEPGLKSSNAQLARCRLQKIPPSAIARGSPASTTQCCSLALPDSQGLTTVMDFGFWMQDCKRRCDAQSHECGAVCQRLAKLQLGMTKQHFPDAPSQQKLPKPTHVTQQARRS